MRRQQLTSFYLEALLLVAAFVAMILVLTGVFGAARVRSAQARHLTQAVTIAANAAEAVSAADSLDRAAALLYEGGNVLIAHGRLEAFYLADGRPCLDGNCALRLTASWETSAQAPELVVSRIAVFAADERTPVYTLETACCGKGAAA